MPMNFLIKLIILISWCGFGVSKTITSTSTITATVPAPTSTKASASYTSDGEFRSSVLNSTNFYRDQHNAAALKWNVTLANYATNYATKCLWKHSHGPSGENLAEGYPNTTAAIEAWGNERDKYDFGRPTGFSEYTGHFTQLVWKNTNSVGCGRVECKNTDKDGVNGWFVVCEYWPAGNVDGQYKTEVQTQTKGRKHILGAINLSRRWGVGWELVMSALAMTAVLQLC